MRKSTYFKPKPKLAITYKINFLIYAAFFYVHQIDKKFFFSLYFHSHKYNLCYSDGKIYATLMEK